MPSNYFKKQNYHTKIILEAAILMFSVCMASSKCPSYTCTRPKRTTFVSLYTAKGGLENSSEVKEKIKPYFAQQSSLNLQPNDHDCIKFKSNPDFPYESSPLSSILDGPLCPLPFVDHLRFGLTSTEADFRLSTCGPNYLKPPPKKNLFQIWLDQFDDELVKILLAVAFLSASFSASEMITNVSSNLQLDPSYGEDAAQILSSFLEPLTILLILMLNAVVGMWQTISASASLESLQKMQPRLATVLRCNELSFSQDKTNLYHGEEDWISVIDATTLVPGDVILLKVGDRIPADARIVTIETSTLSVDESSLTGESISVQKLPGDEGILVDSKHGSEHSLSGDKLFRSNIPISNQKGMVFAGTTVTSGRAKALVVRTGMDTEIGKIQSSMMFVESAKTPLGKKLDSFGEKLSILIFFICTSVIIISFPHFSDPSFNSFTDGAIFYAKVGVALGVAAIPEGLPAVIGLCLSLGTRRMAERNVIVRKLPSVETLGCTTVICTDKTGTLTTNQMTAVSLVLLEGYSQNGYKFVEHQVHGTSYTPVGSVNGIDKMEVIRCPVGSVADICQVMVLCNDARLVSQGDGENRTYIPIGEPTEAALLCLAEKLGPPSESTEEPSKVPNINKQRWKELWGKCASLEFDRKRKSMSVLCRSLHKEITTEQRTIMNSTSHKLLVKGAPNQLLSRCTHAKLRDGEVIQLTPELREGIEFKISELGRRPLRCILAAVREDSILQSESFKEILTNSSNFERVESNLTLVGCVGIKDPARKEARDSIDLCERAGVRVIMITGDSKETAISIAKDVNIFSDDNKNEKNRLVKAMEGEQFFLKPKLEQISILESGNIVLCRTEPTDKQRIVKMLQNDLGEIVCMTGDGINDAPALRQAAIGIAMGTGTDVAKEAADMVLVDDNFSTIVNAIEEGRCIYANMQAFINFLISCNIGEVFAVFFATILGFPFIFTAMQLLWINLITDGPPATALAFNPPDRDLMAEKPRPTDDEIISPWLLARYTICGAYIGIATVGIFAAHYLEIGITIDELHCTSVSSGIQCNELFDNKIALPRTLALTTLVSTELLKALSSISVNTSLASISPSQNRYLLVAVSFSFIVHLLIIYGNNLGLPLLSETFGLVPLSWNNWLSILKWSAPIILVEEILKAIGRQKQN